MLDLIEELRSIATALEAAGSSSLRAAGSQLRSQPAISSSLDLLVVTPALEAVRASREQVLWKHEAVPVVSRIGLIQMKRLRGNGQDLDPGARGRRWRGLK